VLNREADEPATSGASGSRPKINPNVAKVEDAASLRHRRFSRTVNNMANFGCLMEFTNCVLQKIYRKIAIICYLD